MKLTEAQKILADYAEEKLRKDGAPGPIRTKVTKAIQRVRDYVNTVTGK